MAHAPDDHVEPYRKALAEHGPSFEATLWTSRAKQAERFRIIADAHDLTGRTILDAGCGLGDLAAWLTDNSVTYGRYIGLEALPELVEAATARTLPEARFEVVDFVTDRGAFAAAADRHGIDVIIFSGSLNTLEPDRARDVLDRAWPVAAEAVIFNFLSTAAARPSEDTGPARRFDPIDMFRWALGHTRRIALRQDYFDGHDATVVMKK